MLKVLIKNLLVLVICVNIIYGIDYLPSTSPTVKVIKGKQKIQRLLKTDSNVITFSEFPFDTKITDQYANRGIIFKGDTPFISIDASNPTSPVLSGTPRFNGAIEGHFVDPETHEPKTVNHFELDAGYFDNLSSTRLSWYNLDGELIREVLDSQYEIQHFSIDDEGIAYFRIEIVAQEDAGYAIDNISFVNKESPFNHKFNLDKITHTANSHVANTFTIYFKDLETTKDEATLAEICNYNFFVEDKSQKLKGECFVDEATKAFKLNFTLTKSPYNLEDAIVTICEDSECREIEDIKDFSVYGTSFDVTKDAFSFRNGGWNAAEYQFGFWSHDLTPNNDIAYAMEVIANTLSDEKKYDFIEHVGWSKKFSITPLTIQIAPNKEGKLAFTTSEGLCYGMAAANIANFNHKRLGNQPWGVGGDVKTEFKKQIENHWDKETKTIRQNGQYKPFALDNIYSYKANDIEVLKKIMYYYVQQYFYNKNIKEDMSIDYIINSLIKNYNYSVGSYVSLSDIDIQGGIDELKINSPVLVNVNQKHSIQAVENIKYNQKDIWYFYDNNYPSKYTFLDNSSDKIKTMYISDNNYYSVDDISVVLREVEYTDINKKISLDPEAYYGTPIRRVEDSEKNVRVNKKIHKLENLGKNTLSLNSVNHIELFLVGGKFLKVIDLENNKEVVVNPIINGINQNKAYIQENNIFSNYLFLPKDKRYKVSFEKAPNFPFLKLFTKVPFTNGEVELTNYDHIEKDEVGITLAYIYIGKDSNKTIMREGAEDYNCTFSKTYIIQITPVTFIKAVALENGGVKLTWNLPDNPNLEEVVIVRKEGSKPISMTDGIEIYRGVDESFIDSSAQNNKEYYYGIYTIAKNGDMTDGQFIYVNTHQASIYGFVKDSNTNNPVKGVEVVLKNGVGLVKKVIATEITDKNGYFSFRNLPLGTYLLEFVHSNYTFANSVMTVKLENKNIEVSQEAIGQPILAISANMVMKVDENITISWDGLNIEDGAKLNIKLKRNDKWELLASNIDFNKHFIHWRVTKPEDKNATLRVELSSNQNIYAEKQIYIFGKDEIKYDFNEDGNIDIKDIMKVVSHWATRKGDGKFDSIFDLNRDEIIDIKDIMIIVNMWNSH